MLNLNVIFNNTALLIGVIACSACVDKSTNHNIDTNTKHQINSTVQLSSMSTAVKRQPELNFSINEGKIHNNFFRQGNVAAHTLLKSGTSPRIVVAFPAGNSGVSLWFKKLEQSIQ